MQVLSLLDITDADEKPPSQPPELVKVAKTSDELKAVYRLRYEVGINHPQCSRCRAGCLWHVQVYVGELKRKNYR